ncbi:Response regulator receiver domain [Carpediemonas membranifera]|uniref:histidine kinase n=1 Tax=Carpediemonas membranifera TaxID=201153 RepID=A0A8J6B7M0_9EUKA|nr:Response regulator receiver domain [Carpediemonas membranifera]|eukprot:KAG9395944.1 Response regulator receiver domain [Carpediemonas membranifera]
MSHDMEDLPALSPIPPIKPREHRLPSVHSLSGNWEPCGKVVQPLKDLRGDMDPFPSIDEVEFTDIFELSLLQDVQDCLSEALTITTQIVTPGGKPITSVSNASDMCKILWSKRQATPEYNPEEDFGAWLFKQCALSGLLVASTTVRLSKRVIARWNIGHVRSPGMGMPASVRDFVVSQGLQGDEMAEMWSQIPQMTSAQFSDKVSFVRLFALQMSNLAYKSFRANQYAVELKQKNRLLKERAVFLEALFQERGEDLIAANRQLKDSLQTRRLFLSRVSHDMRSPLLGVVGTAQLLKEDSRTNFMSDEERASSLSIMGSSCEMLLGFVDNLLDFTKLELEEETRTGFILDEKAVDLGSFARSVVSLFHGMVTQKQLHVQVRVSDRVPKAVVVDPLRVAQLISNFAGNSIKFTPVGGSIEVAIDRLEPDTLPADLPDTSYAVVAYKSHARQQTMTCVLGLSDSCYLHSRTTMFEREEIIKQLPRPEPGKVLISVVFTDTGLGVERSQLYTIFSAFSQEKVSTLRKFGGSGLGLSMCRSVCVDMYGGIIIAANRPTGGALFAAFLPLQVTEEATFDPFKSMSAVHPVFKRRGVTYHSTRPHTQGKPPRPPKAERTARPASVDPNEIRILVVDDLEVNRIIVGRLLKLALGKTGRPFNISYASDGTECLALTETNTYDVVLLDLQMPDMSGNEVVQRIRERENAVLGASRHQVVLALSGSDAHVMAALVSDGGFDGFLTKPFKQTELTAILSRYCALRDQP